MVSLSTRDRRLFVADAQTMCREALKASLTVEGFEVAGEAADGQTAITVCRNVQPRVAILDIGLPLLNGIDSARVIRKFCANTRIILLTTESQEPYLATSLRAGIDGCVLKNAGFSSLVQAIEAVCKGEIYFSPELSRSIFEAYSNGRHVSDPLSGRERQVLQVIAEGKNMKEIGCLLGISAKTAHTHRGRIMRKLGIFNTAGLVRYALKNGLVIETTTSVDKTTKGFAAD